MLIANFLRNELHKVGVQIFLHRSDAINLFCPFSRPDLLNFLVVRGSSIVIYVRHRRASLSEKTCDRPGPFRRISSLTP